MNRNRLSLLSRRYHQVRWYSSLNLSLYQAVLAVLICFMTWTSVFAANSPAALLKEVGDNMVKELQAHQTELKTHPAVIHDIVTRTLIPAVDVNRMSGLVVGRQYWYAAAPDLRRRFVNLFQRLVINTYSNALASYDNDKLVIYPMRQAPEGRISSVQTVIVRKDGRRIGITYEMILQGDQWKVYDFSVEGVSIVSNYHSQFADTLATGGLSALVSQLQARLPDSSVADKTAVGPAS